MSIGRIVVDLLARTGSFETDLNRSAKLAEKRAKEIDAAIRKAGAAIGTGLVAAGTAAAVALKATINSMDDVSKSAQKVGLSTEEFSKLTYAAGLADVSMETLTGSLGKLTKSQAAALDVTSQQAKVFDALGISVTNADGSLRSSSGVLEDFADRFKELKGSPEAMAAGFAIFGRSFQDLVPLLKDGGDGIRAAGEELESLGGVLSTEAGHAAEAFNDNLTRLQTSATSLAMQVASDLLPDLVDLTNGMVDLARDGSAVESTASGIADSFRALGDVVEFLTPLWTAFVDVVRGLTIQLAGTVGAAQSLISLDWNGLKTNIDGVFQGRSLMLYGREIAGATGAGGRPEALAKRQTPTPMGERVALASENLRNEADERLLRQALGGGSPKGGGARSRRGSSGPSDAEREAKQLLETYERLAESQREQVALFGDTSEAAKIRYATELGDLSKLSDLQKSTLIAGAERLDQMDADAEALKVAIDLEEQNTRAKDAARERTSGLIDDMKFELSLLGMTNAEREREIALRHAGKDATKAQKDEIVALADALIRADEMRAFVDDLNASLSDMFVDFASGAKSAKEAFGDFADHLFATALQFLADKAVQALFNSFSGGTGGAGGAGGGGGGGGWAGFLTSLFGSFGGARAIGGPVDPSKGYLVGEKGPEWFQPSTAGRVLPADMTASMMRGGGAGVQQTNHFHYSAPYDERTEQQKNARLAYLTGRATARNR